jgi:hypothetical protein
MALIPCHECSAQISSSAAACPSCGAPIFDWQRKPQKAPRRGVGAAIALAIFGCIVLVAVIVGMNSAVELPPGAYGRVTQHEWACQRYEGFEVADRAFVTGGVEAYTNVVRTLWGSGSCISFSKGDPLFFEGERKQGFVKVGKTKSEINYFARPTIVNSALLRRDAPLH